MSASLVGSEMCIRDRDCAIKCKELGVTALHIKMRATGGNRTKSPGPGAVSYTHLTLPTICSV
eukprot:10166907-Alexandrium_andersonii.AAC.1